MDKAEIQRELDHVNKVLKIAHDNRRALEQQQIQQGMIAPLNLINQMNEIKSAIQELEERKNNLEIQSVEEDYSLAEAEYRVIAAEVWESGYLKAQGSAKLELARLRLKLLPNEAKVIENEERVKIVNDIFRDLEIDLLFQIYDNHQPSSNNTTFSLSFNEGSYNEGVINIGIDQRLTTEEKEEISFIKLGRCIILSTQRTLDLLLIYLQPVHYNNINYFIESLVRINRTNLFPVEQPSYQLFVQELINQKPESDSSNS